jgi:hypothetical protein
METLLCKVTNGQGVAFNVTLRKDGKHPCFAFYDDRFHGSSPDSPWREFGQFVASYRMKTLLDGGRRLMDCGLCLNGGVADWQVTGENMRDVFAELAMAQVKGN